MTKDGQWQKGMKAVSAVLEEEVMTKWDVTYSNNTAVFCELVASQFRVLIAELHLASADLLMKQVELVTEPSSARGVVARTDLAKGAITIYPMGKLEIRNNPHPTGCVPLGYVGDCKGTKYYANASSLHRKREDVMPGLDRPGQKSVDEFYSVYFMVETCARHQAGNMEFEAVSRQIKGNFPHSGIYYITAMKNRTEIKKGERLCFAAASLKNKYPIQDKLKVRRVV